MTLTVLVGTKGKVTANFPLVQPSLQADATKIGHAIVQALGGETAPTLKEMGFEERRMARRKSPKAKSCILIWLDGGPSHLESLDPKPNAPQEVRGPFGTIASSVAGIRLSHLMPRTAAAIGHTAIIRSMTSPLGEHNFGTHYLSRQAIGRSSKLIDS